MRNVKETSFRSNWMRHVFDAIKHILYILMLINVLFPAYVNADARIETNRSNKVTLHYFWSRYCPHCIDAKSFINQLPKTYPWLTLKSYDLVGSKENNQRYLQMAEPLQQTANSVPAFIFCNQMMVGYERAETTGKELEEKLLACHYRKNNQQPELQRQFNLPGFGEVHYKDFSLPVFTVLIAALDAFNPCAFFILFSC